MVTACYSTVQVVIEDIMVKSCPWSEQQSTMTDPLTASRLIEICLSIADAGSEIGDLFGTGAAA